MDTGLVAEGIDSQTGKKIYKIRRQNVKRQARDRYLQFPAPTPSTSLMTSGGQCVVRVNGGSAGKIKSQFWGVNYTVSGSQVKLLPMTLWASLIQNYKDTSTTVTQQFNDFNHIVHHNLLTREKFRQVADKLLCKEDGWNCPFLQPGTYTAEMRIIGSIYEDLYLRKIKNDMNVEINFNGAGVIDSGTGTVTVNSVYIRLKEHDLDDNEEAMLDSQYSSGAVIKNFISYNRFSQTVTLTSGIETKLQLNSIRNNNGFLVFCIRSSVSPTSGAIKKLLKLGDNYQVGVFELQDSGGRSITGLKLDAEYSLKVGDNPQYFDGDLCKKYYFYVIGHGHPADVIQGIPSGFIKYTGLEYLSLTPANSTAETARVVTFNVKLASTLAATAATAGNVQLCYSRGDGTSYTSPPIAFNAGNVTINAAIAAMQIPDISVVSATGFNNTAGCVLTITNQTEADLAVNGAEWSATGCSLSNGTLPILVDVTDTTAGITLKGFVTGSYIVDVWGATFRQMRIVNGMIDVADYDPVINKRL